MRRRRRALRPVKVNAVLVRGINDDEVEAFAEFARERDLIMRFIEYMPLDADRSWTREMVVTAAEMHQRISARWPLVPIAHERSETARKYRFADGRGEIGLIAPVSQPFCGHCSRMRLTADGKLRTCLFSKDDHDLKFLLRGGASDNEIARRNSGHRRTKGKGPSHQRARLRAALAHHGFYRRLSNVTGSFGAGFVLNRGRENHAGRGIQTFFFTRSRAAARGDRAHPDPGH